MNKQNYTRRNFLRTIGLGAASLTLTGCSKTSHPPQSGKQPNILYIMSDDHASNAISCYGGIYSEIAGTPNIDRIANEGIRLNNCFCTNSICAPSRACVLTGQYSHLNGIYSNRDKFDPEHQNVGKLLRKAGYQTAIIGKWHLKNEPNGFDYWNVLPGQGRYHSPILIEKKKDRKTYEGQYSTDVITDLSLNWLRKRDKEKPFFLMCHFKATHRSWQPAKRFADLFKDIEIPEPHNLFDDYKNRSRSAANSKLKIGEDMNERDLKQKIPKELTGNKLRKWAYQLYMKDYLRCVAAIDENVGRILDFLDNQGLTENTVVIYTSDQGFFLGEHGYFDKRFFYEESLRMPFVMRYPGEIKPGIVNDDIILNIDFAPTFLDYAGQPVNPDMQGRSFRSNLTEKTPKDWRTSMYYAYWEHLAAHGVPAHYGIRTKRYKLIFFHGQGLGDTIREKFKPTEPEWEFFDMEKDPYEMNNVYDDPAYADVIKDLKKELLQLKEHYGDTDEQYPELMKVRQKYW